MSNSVDLIFERPWLLLLLIPALAIVLIPFFLLPAKRRKTFRKIVPAVLHSIAVVLCVLLVAGIGIRHTSSDNAVVLLLDVSDSARGLDEVLLAEGEKLLEMMKDEQTVGAVAFAGNAVTLLKPGENGTIGTQRPEEIEGDTTDISTALTYAAELLPKDKAGRILLLSDGKQTDHDAVKTAKALAQSGVRIDTMWFDGAQLVGPEMQLTSFDAPQTAYLNRDLKLTAAIDSNYPGGATLLIYENGLPVYNAALDVEEGRNVVEYTVIPRSVGNHVFTAKLSPEKDTLSENNERTLCVDVSGGPRVLILAGSVGEGTFFSSVLSKDASVDLQSARTAPDSIVDLCRYDQVILVNANTEDLPYGFERLLQTYVSVYGRSLLVVGGEESLSLGNMQNTGYEELLPVGLDYKKSETQQALALMLVLDCSRSMSMNGSNNLSLAKQGAIRCLETISDVDSVGVVSFGGTAKLEKGLMPGTLQNKEEISRAIAGITTESGTKYEPALIEAYEELKKSNAPLKHVIFLSDGQPSDHDYLSIAEKMSEDGITISTIGLGFYSYALPDVAAAGLGRYYSVLTANELPDIMLSEAKMVTTSPLMAGRFDVHIPNASEVTRGVDVSALPQVTGYIGTVAKEESEICLTVGKGDPLYAVWDYGKGKVACFTSDLSGNWTDGWRLSESARKLVYNTSFSILTENAGNSSLNMRILQEGRHAKVYIETAVEESGALTLNAVYKKEEKNYVPNPVGKGLYLTEIDTDAAGLYELTVTLSDARNNVLDFVQIYHPVSYSPEYDAFAEGAKLLLSDVAGQSNGVAALYGEDEAVLVGAEKRTTQYTQSLLLPFGITAMVLFLADVAIRRIRWKDLEALFGNLLRKGRTKA